MWKTAPSDSVGNNLTVVGSFRKLASGQWHHDAQASGLTYLAHEKGASAILKSGC